MPLLKAPPNGVTVRMYRLGHGDCFLLAMPRAGGGDPYYVLIDCGYKPGSPAFLDAEPRIGEVVEHLYESCGGRIDLAILTHEHQDHLNGIWKAKNPYFEDFQIDEAWLAWTESPTHDLANKLRKRHQDQLLGLLAARRELALAVGENDPAVQRVDQMLAFELGGGAEKMDMAELRAAAENPEKSVNKQALKLVKEKALAGRGYRCLQPGGTPRDLEGSAGVRAFILGPPEDEALIADEDPKGEEGFPRDNSFSFTEAARAGEHQRKSPFTSQYRVPIDEALSREGFFAKRYGRGDAGGADQGGAEVPDGAPWRRIDDEWLYSAETLAIKMNTGVNNTCLVVAFELPASKKVLLFAADAQRGNWISWKDVEFEDGTTPRDLLARTVLYKVGHHGSHNATLMGRAEDDHANLAWMGLEQHASEFTAMITAVGEWATTKNNPPWSHPLPSLKKALVRKAQGRVLQIDENEPEQPRNVSDGEWKRFTDRVVLNELYFDLTIEDA